MRKPLRRRAFPCLLLVAIGCPTSPEDGRARGGGPGADGGNYRTDHVAIPSKLDGTKDLRPLLPTGR